MTQAGKLQSIIQLVKSIQKDQREGPGGPYSIDHPDGPSGDRYLQLSMYRGGLFVVGNVEVLAGQSDPPEGDNHSSGLMLDFKMLWNGFMMERNLALMR